MTYSIITSAAEYVTSVHMRQRLTHYTTSPRMSEAKRMTHEEARAALKTIKASIDSAAQIFENPS